jgi:hypothetical protein
LVGVEGDCVVKERGEELAGFFLVPLLFAVAAPPWIIVCSILVPYLSSALSTAILSIFFKSSVPICPNCSVVKTCAIDPLLTCLCRFSCIIFNKTKTTRCLLYTIKAHDNAFYFSTFGKQFVYLLFGRVERKISHIQGSSICHYFVPFFVCAFKMLVSVLVG